MPIPPQIWCALIADGDRVAVTTGRLTDGRPPADAIAFWPGDVYSAELAARALELGVDVVRLAAAIEQVKRLAATWEQARAETIGLLTTVCGQPDGGLPMHT